MRILLKFFSQQRRFWAKNYQALPSPKHPQTKVMKKALTFSSDIVEAKSNADSKQIKGK
jgi:hypothetical protein